MWCCAEKLPELQHKMSSSVPQNQIRACLLAYKLYKTPEPSF